MPKIITRSEAKNSGESHYFTGKACVNGHISTRRVKDRVCMECQRDYRANLRETQPEVVAIKKKQSYEKTKAHHLAQKREYRQANKGKIAALNTARKAYVKQRTPTWLSNFDKLKIKCVYSVAAMLTRENNEPWHVDHIIPLQGKLVSGLHVPNNLQVMRGIDNIGKKNKYEVDYA